LDPDPLILHPQNGELFDHDYNNEYLKMCFADQIPLFCDLDLDLAWQVITDPDPILGGHFSSGF
jgi:hypothetical protein